MDKKAPKTGKNLQTRVVSGKIKGKLIEFTPGTIRPMTAKVKQALFNIIKDCADLKMLDLYTGSGNIAIEAFSNGLENADLVEIDSSKRETLLRNLDNAGFTSAKVYIEDAFKFCERSRSKYDFIMLDPPFKMENKKDLIELISNKELLNKNGFIVIHISNKDRLDNEIGSFSMYDKRKYGRNILAFYSYK
jgi:16S rRNA (guanine966-N2)-methyltransferase